MLLALLYIKSVTFIEGRDIFNSRGVDLYSTWHCYSFDVSESLREVFTPAVPVCLAPGGCFLSSVVLWVTTKLEVNREKY